MAGDKGSTWWCAIAPVALALIHKLLRGSHEPKHLSALAFVCKS